MTKTFFTHVDRREPIEKIASNVAGGGMYQQYENQECCEGAAFVTEQIVKIEIKVTVVCKKLPNAKA